MKKILIAALAGSVAFGTTSVATAAHVGVTFETEEECKEFLAQSRNNARKASDENPGQFNKEWKDEYYCEENEDGTYTTERR